MAIHSIILLILIAAIIIFSGLVIGGVYSLIKYRKTKKSLYLILGLASLLFALSIIAYLFVVALWPTMMLNMSSLKLSTIEGNAPLKVEVIGPEYLVMNRNRNFSRAGCGFGIEWNDYQDFHEGEPCSDNLYHTYTIPGTYRVIASIVSGPGPDDSVWTKWSDTVTVTVH